MNALAQTPNQQVTAATQTAADKTQYLTFMLGGEVFAIGILAIREIIEYSSLTTVPMMPACIRGVINLRGAVVPVMDLSARFGKRSNDVTKRTCIVIVEMDADGEHRDMGVIVDAVNAVLEIAPSDIEPAPSFGANIRTEFIAGMGKVNNNFVILLNVDNVLSTNEIVALSELAPSVQANATVAIAA